MGLNENLRIAEYLDDICTQIKYREIHPQIRFELEAHIKEIAEEYLSQPISEDEAVSKAIAHMGEAVEIGKKLNQVHKPGPDWSILTSALLFIGLGLSALFFMQSTALIQQSPIFSKSMLFTIIGTAILVSLYFFDYRKIQPYSKYVYLGTVLVLFLTIFSGDLIAGKSRWNFGHFQFDFVSLSPYLFVLALAGLLDNWNWTDTKKIFSGLLLFLAPLALLLFAGSLTAGAVYLTASIVLVLFSGMRPRYTLLLIGSGIGMLVFPIINAPYRFARLLAFINPADDSRGSGYVYLQLKKLLDSSGFFGQGFSLQPRLIPSVHTDFIFTYITYSLGWIAGFAVMALIIYFLVRIAYISSEVKSNYAKLVTTGFLTIFAVQFIWNISMNLGFAPISGVGLPFISYGGSQLIINSIALGIILSIHQRRNLTAASGQ